MNTSLYIYRDYNVKIKGETMFVVKQYDKDEMKRLMKGKITDLEGGNWKIFTGAAQWDDDQRRWVIPTKEVNLAEVTTLRVKKLIEYLLQSNFRHTTRRDVWYAITTEKWGLYNPNFCPKCGNSNLREGYYNNSDWITGLKPTGRTKKDGTAIMQRDLNCKGCNFCFTDLKDPYGAMGGDLIVVERLIGVEKEDLGVHSGQKGFLYGSRRMQIYTPTRGMISLDKRPTIMFDLAKANTLSGFNKLIMLEKESFVDHLAPIEDMMPNFKFLNMIDAGIITSQGYEGKYNKTFGRICLDHDIKLLSFHDADPDGIEMDLVLNHHSMAGAHLPDNLILRPYRMGFFPSIGQEVNSPTTPMSKEHIKKLKDLKKRINEKVNDPLYTEEVEILLNQKERWELQSMNALHETAGQAYVLEYLRNRQIPLKPNPDLNRIRRQIWDNYDRKNAKSLIEYKIGEVIEDFVTRKITDVIKREVLERLDIDGMINDLEDFPDLPTNEELNWIWQDRMSKRLVMTTKSTENKVVEEFGEILTTAELDEDMINIESEDGKICINAEEIVDNLSYNVDRVFNDLTSNLDDTDPNFYDTVLEKCNINKQVAEQFKRALTRKFDQVPIEEEEFVIPEEAQPDPDFDEL